MHHGPKYITLQVTIQMGNSIFILEVQNVNLQHYTVLYSDLQQENLKLIDYYVNKV